MGPAGIEPAPLVLQTNVRTSYTKDPLPDSTLQASYTLHLRFYLATFLCKSQHISLTDLIDNASKTNTERKSSNPIAVYEGIEPSSPA